MKVYRVIFFCLISLCYSVAQEIETRDIYYPIHSQSEWERLQNEAKTTSKDILLYFSGSDWCVNCHALQKNVISKDAFFNYVNSSVYLVNIDFPQKELDITEDEVLFKEYIADLYNPEGIFPRMILMDTNEKVLVDLQGYKGLSFEDYLSKLNNQ